MSIAAAVIVAAPRVQTRAGAPRLALLAQRRVRTPTARRRPLVARPAAALVELAPGIVIDSVQFVHNVAVMTTVGMVFNTAWYFSELAKLEQLKLQLTAQPFLPPACGNPAGGFWRPA